MAAALNRYKDRSSCRPRSSDSARNLPRSSCTELICLLVSSRIRSVLAHLFSISGCGNCAISITTSRGIPCCSAVDWRSLSNSSCLRLLSRNLVTDLCNSCKPLRSLTPTRAYWLTNPRVNVAESVPQRVSRSLMDSISSSNLDFSVLKPCCWKVMEVSISSLSSRPNGWILAGISRSRAFNRSSISASSVLRLRSSDCWSNCLM